MMFGKYSIHTIAFVILMLLFSCAKEQAPQTVLSADGCRDTLFTFNKDILPIMNLSCNFSECHNKGGEGSYDLSNYGVVANRIRAGTFEYRIDLPADDPQHMPENMVLNKC